MGASATERAGRQRAKIFPSPPLPRLNLLIKSIHSMQPIYCNVHISVIQDGSMSRGVNPANVRETVSCNQRNHTNRRTREQVDSIRRNMRKAIRWNYYWILAKHSPLVLRTTSTGLGDEINSEDRRCPLATGFFEVVVSNTLFVCVSILTFDYNGIHRLNAFRELIWTQDPDGNDALSWIPSLVYYDDGTPQSAEYLRRCAVKHENLFVTPDVYFIIFKRIAAFK